MDEKAEKYTDEQLTMIDQGLAEFERGEAMTSEQTLRLAKERTKAWLNVTAQSLSA